MLKTFSTRFLLFFLYLSIGNLGLAQDSWQEAKKKGNGSVTIIYFDFAPFAYEENGSIKGIEYELLMAFFDFIEKKYNVKVSPRFVRSTNFAQVYDTLLVSKNGILAAASFSITEKRLKEIKFTPAYLPDVEVLICSNNIPIVKDTAEFVKVFAPLQALSIRKSSYEQNLIQLQKWLPNMKLQNLNHFEEVSRRIASEDNLYSYAQLTSYILERKKGTSIKRQNMFQVEKTGQAIAMPKTSDWDEPWEAFFEQPEFNTIRKKILLKYFGDDINELMEAITSTDKSVGGKAVDLLTLETEMQNLQLKNKSLEVERQTAWRNSFLVGLLVLAAIAFFIYNRYRAKQRTNILLEQKNQEIEKQKAELIEKNEELAQLNEEIIQQREAVEQAHISLQRRNDLVSKSIQSALTIQQAMLPYPHRLQDALGEYFVVYEPKDIVSGDFYWLGKVNHQTIVAVADCTGHGIPGAFMSLIGTIIFDKIIVSQQITDPATILNAVHLEIMQALKQDESDNRDGMDTAILRIEEASDAKATSKRLAFCGAKRSLYYVSQNNPSTLQEIRGERKSIGGKQNENKQFKTHTFELEKDSLVYLSTDGFADQNNLQRKKIGEEGFKALLLKNAQQTLTEQANCLLQALADHKQDLPQRDDILVIGFRL